MDPFEKSGHQRAVEEFMRRAGQLVPPLPMEPSAQVRLLRARLILEEALETIQRGLGIRISTWLSREDVTAMEAEIRFDRLSFDIDDMFSMADTVDGCCDLRVVTTGTLSACGVADVEPQAAVDRANLEKFGPGSWQDEHGKWRKPPGWQHPDMDGILKRQGWKE